ncbi:hypothetical protein MVEG_06131 [Podila verticillata NRRL 6337]|nr:hypothetical protein MVEG_06131 [Podila verticillata NRRL 6337]
MHEQLGVNLSMDWLMSQIPVIILQSAALQLGVMDFAFSVSLGRFLGWATVFSAASSHDLRPGASSVDFISRWVWPKALSSW